MKQAHSDPTSEQVMAIAVRARRYLQEPTDAPWDDVLRTLREALGDDEADELLRAIWIRYRTAG